MNLFPRDPRTVEPDPDGRSDGQTAGQDRLVALPGGAQTSAPAGAVGRGGPSTSALQSPSPIRSLDQSAPTGGADAARDPGVLMPSPVGPPAFLASTRPGLGPRVSPPDPYEDLLTGLVGPAVWRRLLSTESARSVRHSRPLTVVLVELSGLENFARRWGAETATTAVLALSRAVRAGSRESDHLARVDVGRFGLILDQTDEIAAINCVERLRDACLFELRGAEDELHVGFGWASPETNESVADAVARAAVRLNDDLADAVA